MSDKDISESGFYRGNYGGFCDLVSYDVGFESRFKTKMVQANVTLDGQEPLSVSYLGISPKMRHGKLFTALSQFSFGSREFDVTFDGETQTYGSTIKLEGIGTVNAVGAGWIEFDGASVELYGSSADLGMIPNLEHAQVLSKLYGLDVKLNLERPYG